MSIGEKLKKLRGNKTQDDIAAALGISKSAWAMYERDERVPRDEIKVLISNYFKVSIENLFYN